MTVEELMEKLKDLDPKADVLIGYLSPNIRSNRATDCFPVKEGRSRRYVCEGDLDAKPGSQTFVLIEFDVPERDGDWNVDA